MSSSQPGGGGFGGAPRGLPQGITQEQLDEIKAFNAGLTQAGNKSRPARSGGSGLNQGQGSGIAPGRGGRYASISPRPGSGVGYGGSVSYSVGPSTASPIAKTTTAREAVPSHSRGWVDVTKTRWANLDSTGAATLATQFVGPINSAPASSKSRSRSPTRSSILTTLRAQPSPPKVLQQQQQSVIQPVIQPLQNAPQGQDPVTRIPTPPGRQRIVTNMTPDDPTKPWIPAHLQQKSVRKTLEEISRMTGLPMSEITSDGFSIPAHRPGGSTAGHTSDLAMPTSRQVVVDAAVDTHNVVANQNKADNPGNAQQTLADSRWAQAPAFAPQNNFASAFTAVPTAAATSGWVTQQPTEAAQTGPVNNTWGTVPAAPAASGWTALVQQAVSASQPGVANNGNSWDTAGLNRWTQAQPVSASDIVPPAQNAGFGSHLVQAHPSNTGGWGTAPAQTPAAPARPSGHARIPSDVEMTGATSILDEPISNVDLFNDQMNQMLTAMPKLADSRWADPSYSRSSHTAPSTSSSNRAVETGRQALSETTPSGFCYNNTQNQAPATNSCWPTTAPVQPVAAPQAQPFSNHNIADFNQRITAEINQANMLVDVSAQPSQPVGPGPAHLRHAPQNINRATPGVSTENAPPKPVQYLKDSRWAH
ncbi:hypothetical protein NA56DRAFT_133628 [Hyaloscypha hepaticicola]|uniref:Uncharacterized protein n=1 Tax=Hyaloscypha hepaticicola TaxID=2082293 RepID=A0A2J6Q4E2_9HELO|nr:hypothetical protein NA56DRAFT_133628 [Hyaloscypha hepaticicola]